MKKTSLIPWSTVSHTETPHPTSPWPLQLWMLLASLKRRGQGLTPQARAITTHKTLRCLSERCSLGPLSCPAHTRHSRDSSAPSLDHSVKYSANPLGRSDVLFCFLPLRLPHQLNPETLNHPESTSSQWPVH